MQPPFYLMLPDAAWWITHGRIVAFVLVVLGLAWLSWTHWAGRASAGRWGVRMLTLLALGGLSGAGLWEAFRGQAAVARWWADPSAGVSVQADGATRVVVLGGAHGSWTLSWPQAMALTAWRYSHDNSLRVDAAPPGSPAPVSP